MQGTAALLGVLVIMERVSEATGMVHLSRTVVAYGCLWFDLFFTLLLFTIDYDDDD